MLPRSPLKARENGYTLIEVVVVLLIIAILVVIAIPIFFSLRDRGFDAQSKTVLRNGMLAAKEYYIDNITYEGLNSAEILRYQSNADAEDTAIDCSIDPPGSDEIHAVLIVQTGLTDGSACLSSWTFGSDERYVWRVDASGHETLETVP